MKRDLSYSGGSGATIVKPDFGDLVLSDREGYLNPVLTLETQSPDRLGTWTFPRSPVPLRNAKIPNMI